MKLTSRNIGIILVILGTLIMGGNQISNGKIELPTKTSKTETQIIHKGYKVKKVVDGDTISVYMKDGTVENIRFVGINTPESVDPRRPVQCFGKEASKKMKELLSGEYVLLVKDSVAGDRDKYGRLLRYVYRERDNVFANEYMIKEGYAYEYTYNGQKYDFKTSFKQLQKNAQEQKVGLWSADTCNGKK